MNTLCKKIPDGEEVVVYGDGSNARDYIYVDDVVSELLLGIDQNGIYNVGTGIETTVLDLIGLVEKITNKKPRIKFEKENENEIKNSRADISKIKRLGWKPKISLEEGIRRLME